jgi:hypothetical protein
VGDGDSYRPDQFTYFLTKYIAIMWFRVQEHMGTVAKKACFETLLLFLPPLLLLLLTIIVITINKFFSNACVLLIRVTDICQVTVVVVFFIDYCPR